MIAVMPSLLLSQVQEKKDLMQTLNKVPPQQASVRETYGNATRDEGAGTPKCRVENRSNPSISKLKMLRIRSKHRLDRAQQRYPRFSSPDMAQKMQDPELKKSGNELKRKYAAGNGDDQICYGRQVLYGN